MKKEILRNIFNAHLKTSFLAKKYYNMKSRVTGKDRRSRYYLGLAICTYTKFLYWAFDNPDFIRLWKRAWKLGWEYGERPSIDRIDNQKGYIIGNMRFVPQRKNSRPKIRVID